jgi:hypothetical protein
VLRQQRDAIRRLELNLAAADQWPQLSTVILLLQRQHVRLRSLFGELTEEQLSSPAATGAGRTVRECVLHALQDEASHKSEMWLLYKLQHRRR